MILSEAAVREFWGGEIPPGPSDAEIERRVAEKLEERRRDDALARLFVFCAEAEP